MDVKLDSSRAQSVLDAIQRCLLAFEAYRPDIGYVQGMTYLAWMLVIRMSDYEAFRSFSNLVLGDPFLSSFYLFEEAQINRTLRGFESCLLERRPKLAKHLAQCGMTPDLFLIEWAFTMYTRAFNIRIASKIWDCWICDGYQTFFKVAMAVLELLEVPLLEEQETDKMA